MDLSIQESSEFVLFDRSYNNPLIGTNKFSMPVSVVVTFHEIEIHEEIPSFWEGNEVSMVSTKSLMKDNYHCDICSEKLKSQIDSEETSLVGNENESEFVLVSHIETEESCVLHGDCFQEFIENAIELIWNNPEMVAASSL